MHRSSIQRFYQRTLWNYQIRIAVKLSTARRGNTEWNVYLICVWDSLHYKILKVKIIGKVLEEFSIVSEAFKMSINIFLIKCIFLLNKNNFMIYS